jgi:hypothetical protein
MKNKEHINNQVDDTFKVLDSIDEVKVNSFFKHKVLQKLNTKKEIKSTTLSWFTPQFQLAALSIVLLLNIGTIFYAFSNSDTSSVSDIDTFAQEYSLQTKSDSLIN